MPLSCVDAEDTPGREEVGTAGLRMSGGAGAGLSVCCPCSSDSLQGLAVSPVHPELHPCAAWGPLCGGRAREAEHCQETGALSLLPLVRTSWAHLL